MKFTPFYCIGGGIRVKVLIHWLYLIYISENGKISNSKLSSFQQKRGNFLLYTLQTILRNFHRIFLDFLIHLNVFFFFLLFFPSVLTGTHPQDCLGKLIHFDSTCNTSGPSLSPAPQPRTGTGETLQNKRAVRNSVPNLFFGGGCLYIPEKSGRQSDRILSAKAVALTYLKACGCVFGGWG